MKTPILPAGLIRRPGRIALLLAFALAPALVRGEETPAAPPAETTVEAPSPAAEAPRRAEAALAFDELVDSANRRFEEKGFEDEGIRRELMAEFAAFAEKFPGTDEAVIALLHRGTLARMMGDYDEAEATFNKAMSLTSAPEIKGEILRGLAELRMRPGADAPDFSAKTVAGKAISPADYKGKVVLLDFWATWCAPCVAELPNLKAVYGRFHPKGLEVVSISLDEDRAYFENFIKKEGMTWTHIYDADQAADRRLGELFGVTSIPRMILIGPDGKVIESSLRGPQLGEAVEKALAVPAKTP